MKKLLVYVILFPFFIAVPVWATSTGLNNIPTADVVPENVLVFQYFSELGNDNVPDHFAGFKYGLMKNIEVGLDGWIFPEKAEEENLVAQGKVRFEPSDKLALGLGVTNLGDRDKAGAEFPFAVLSHDLDFYVFISVEPLRMIMKDFSVDSIKQSNFLTLTLRCEAI